MIRKSIFSSLCITAFVTFFIVSLVSADTETFDETYDVNPGTRLELKNHNGGVKIQKWGRSNLKVQATKKARWGGKLEEVEIKVTPGDSFTIETVHLVRNPKVSVTYDLHVPEGLIVENVRTSNGKIELIGTQGDTIAETSNGKIKIKDAIGNVEAHTSNGAIEIEDVKGFVSARTSNGSIEVEGSSGVEELETSNGAIDAEVPAIGENGLRVRTSNGAIELALAVGLNANLDVRTSNGKIKLEDFEVMVKEVSKSALRGRIGEGGKKISCRTSNGRIVLKKLD